MIVTRPRQITRKMTSLKKRRYVWASVFAKSCSRLGFVAMCVQSGTKTRKKTKKPRKRERGREREREIKRKREKE